MTPTDDHAFLALSQAEHAAASAYDTLAALPTLALSPAEREHYIAARSAAERLHRSLDARRRARVVELHGPPGPAVRASGTSEQGDNEGRR